MKDTATDPRLLAILESAWKAFAAYGFRKTSMDDIARGAGMSRPALYTHYRNKEDIYRSLVQAYYDDTTKEVRQALAGGGSVADCLAAAFEAQGGRYIEAILTSPHGAELLDSGMTMAADIVEMGESGFGAVYSDWLAGLEAAGRVRLVGTPDETAVTIAAALKGIKMTATDFPAYRSRVAQLAAMLGAGLSV